MGKRVFTGFFILMLSVAAAGVIYFGSTRNLKETSQEYAGSESCRECHERFYELWEPSHHGKAMQPMDSSVIALLTPMNSSIIVGDYAYKIKLKPDSLIYEEYNLNGELNRKLPVVWALGGKNVSYFLTPWEKGKLQTLPLAYDYNRKEWYDNPRSGIRDFVEPGMRDSAIRWTHSLYTFNTTCHSCHVSQIEKNFNENTGEYHTIWNEPGINCETCHGPSQGHIDVCRAAAKKGKVPDDLKIISTSNFTKDQHDSSCSSCHAKMVPLTEAYVPGETFYDHFNLVTLEHFDYYADGRDLGENYTYTTWIQSACATKSDMHCVSCHTSSGRYRFAADTNASCASCHADNVNDFESHSHHKVTDGVSCVSCHMPKTEFARMIRSDHSMRPPMPAATIAFGSPNACNICHINETPEWANRHVTQWKGSDFQKETLYYGGLIQEARQGNFDRADEMLKMVHENKPNELFVASIIRLLNGFVPPDFEKALLTAINNTSPLVRSAAAESLGLFHTTASANALLKAAEDQLLAVRSSAGSSLAMLPPNLVPNEKMALRENAIGIYKTSLTTRPDSWSAHYNLANLQAQLGNLEDALGSYQKSSELEPEVIGPLVNASLIHTQLKDMDAARKKLEKALELEPENAPANINYGLLMGELGKFDAAKKAYLKALETDNNLVTAAYNLSIIYGQEGEIEKAVSYAGKASDINSEMPRYAYTHAFYLAKAQRNKEAAEVLEKLIETFPRHYDSYHLLEQIYISENNIQGAINLFDRALSNNEIPQSDKEGIRAHLEQLKNSSR